MASTGFERKAVQIAVAGIYDLRQHLDDVVMPVLRAWRVFDRDDLGPQGEAARASPLPGRPGGQQYVN
jgi:acyl-[acyl-carrier-protein] desaturase